MGLEKLPSVLTENNFLDNGLVETESGLFVPAYVASELGFNVPGRHYLSEVFYPALKQEGVLPLCPFAACAEYLDLATITNEEILVRELKKAWKEFNGLVGKVNYETLMPKAKFMIAIYDGSNASDDGVSAETGYFAAKEQRPIIGIRSDFRLSENIAAPVNPAVRYFIDGEPYDGCFFEGIDAYEGAHEQIKSLADRIRDAA